jgi:hypothetical protein
MESERLTMFLNLFSQHPSAKLSPPYLFHFISKSCHTTSNQRFNGIFFQWHSVSIGRPTKEKHTLMVDEHLAMAKSTGDNIYLDLDGILFLGKV